MISIRLTLFVANRISETSFPLLLISTLLLSMSFTLFVASRTSETRFLLLLMSVLLIIPMIITIVDYGQMHCTKLGLCHSRERPYFSPD